MDIKASKALTQLLCSDMPLENKSSLLLFPNLIEDQ